LTSAVAAHPRHEEYVGEGDLLATWWRQASPGSSYWRCKLPAAHLPGQVLKFKTSDLAENEKGEIVFPRQQGAAIWQFPGNASTGTLMRGMQTEGIRVLMEVDDSYLHAPDVGVHGGWQAELDRSGQTDNFSFPAHEKLAEFVDGIIVSTEPLAELYGEINENVYVCPNSIDPADWPTPDKPDDGILRIGWAASHSHIVDAPLVRRAFRWAAEQPRVEVTVVGIGDAYKFSGAVKRLPWTDDQESYRASLSRFDVLVCPLNETRWSRYKSDLKALESAMAGAWPIVSTATAYKPWHDRTMTCTTAKDWQQALRWTVRHRDEIPALAAKARDYVLGERTIDKSIHCWRDAVAGVR
jgi:hypothetical protein